MTSSKHIKMSENVVMKSVEAQDVLYNSDLLSIIFLYNDIFEIVKIIQSCKFFYNYAKLDEKSLPTTKNVISYHYTILTPMSTFFIILYE